MAMVAQAVELPSPSPSPARVGSTGPIRFLMEKEHRHVEQVFEPFNCRVKSTKEFSNVCKEVVSVSCGQPLLSYKPKKTKCTKTPKALEAPKPAPPSAKSSQSITTVKSARSNSCRVLVNAIRLSGCSEVHLDVDMNQSSLLHIAKDGVQSALRGEAAVLARRPSGLDQTTQPAEYPVFQSSASPMNPFLDDYHKALIPFLRNELDASSRAIKKKMSSQTTDSLHRRSTSLGSSACFTGNSEQLAWQGYRRDSYPPFSESKNYSFFRLTD